MSLLTYKYYDTPEGHDIYKKVFVTSKYAAVAGLTSATYDVLMFSHPKGLFQHAQRFAFFLVPMVGMASAFTVTTNMAQNFRGKNDKINYFLGGVAAGSVFGAWTRSVPVAVPAALLLGALAVVKKMGVDEGWTFVPEMHLMHKSIQSVRHDWTMVEDVPQYKKWTTGKE